MGEPDDLLNFVIEAYATELEEWMREHGPLMMREELHLDPRLSRVFILARWLCPRATRSDIPHSRPTLKKSGQQTVDLQIVPLVTNF